MSGPEWKAVRRNDNNKPNLLDPVMRKLVRDLPEVVRSAKKRFHDFPNNKLGKPGMYLYERGLVIQVERGAKCQIKKPRRLSIETSCSTWANDSDSGGGIEFSSLIHVSSFLSLQDGFLQLIASCDPDATMGSFNLFTARRDEEADSKRRLHIHWDNGKMTRDMILDESLLLSRLNETIDEVSINYCLGVMGTFLEPNFLMMHSVETMLDNLRN